jgi:type IV secretion system protein VirD4
MSRTTSNERIRPAGEPAQNPADNPRGIVLKAIGWFIGAVFAHGIIDPHGHNVIQWSLEMVILGWLASMFVKGVQDGRIDLQPLLTAVRRGLDAVDSERDAQEKQTLLTADDIRAYTASRGGGAYLGQTGHGDWVLADPQSAVMVLGPPRSGKTSCVMIPALLGSAGAAVSTSTKPDVMRATADVRSKIGRIWLFDPSGEETQTPTGMRRLSWSPIPAAATWDGALVIARAMAACAKPAAGAFNEAHWTERAAALLAPLLHAANLMERPIEEVLRWTLRQDPAAALQALHNAGVEMGADVLIGIERTDERERSSIFSATAGVLAAYNSQAVREIAAEPNFDPHQFAASTDTIYITAPEHKQSLCAPLIVGLLEQIRHAVYDQARVAHGERPPMMWLLDEVANVAPIHDLPALVSQAGGQRLQVVIGLQDLSQARTRWGADAADGFMSLFQTRLVLGGIGDSRTLESISLALGEYDRELVSSSNGVNHSGELFAPPSRSEGTSYQTHRQRTLTPGEIAQLQELDGLLLAGCSWDLIKLTPWYREEPWVSIA